MEYKLYAVLTGDVVGFSDSLYSYKKIDRDYDFIEILHHKLTKVVNLITQEIQFPLEAFRGDSFQLVLTNPLDALSVALALRAALISGYPFKGFKEIKPKRLQLRIAIGLGTIEYLSSSASKSDGEAFRKSGPFLDSMKGKEARLSIITPWKSVNDEFDVETALIDTIMNKWTSAQSEAMMYHFAKWTQIGRAHV